MDTSTPVRNLKQTFREHFDHSNRDNKYADEEVLIISSQAPLCTHDEVDRKISEADQSVNLNKSEDLFPFSPITPRGNVSHTLLPIVDSPDLKWTKSMLIPYQPCSENENQTPEPLFFSHNADRKECSDLPTYIDFEVTEKSLRTDSKFFTRSSRPGSPVLRSTNQKRQLKKTAKKLFLTEENSKICDLSFQKINDSALDAIERICQVNETIYSNSAIVSKALEIGRTNSQSLNMEHTSDTSILSLDNVHIPQSENKVYDKDLDQFHCVGSVKCPECHKRRKKFVYPFSDVRKPSTMVVIDEMLESVLALEEYDKISTVKSKPTPRALVCFNRLNINTNYSLDSDLDLCIWSSCDQNIKSRYSNLVWVVNSNKKVYHGLKMFFEINRVDFARMVSQSNAFCAKQEAAAVINFRYQIPVFLNNSSSINYLNRVLVSMKKEKRILVLIEFFEFFQCNLNLLYNLYKPKWIHNRNDYKSVLRKRKVEEPYNRSNKRINVTVDSSNCLSGDQHKSSVFCTNISVENELLVQELLFDVEDSHFQLDVDLDSVTYKQPPFENSETSNLLQKQTGSVEAQNVPKALDNLSTNVQGDVNFHECLMLDGPHSRNEHPEKLLESLNEEYQFPEEETDIWFSNIHEPQSKETAIVFPKCIFGIDTEISETQKINLHSVLPSIDNYIFNSCSTTQRQRIEFESESPVKTKMLLQDISDPKHRLKNNSFVPKSEPILDLHGFSTARRQKIEVKNESLVIANNLLRNVSQDLNHSTEVKFLSTKNDNSVQLGVFSTARGQKIEVKAKSLLVAKKLYRDISEDIEFAVQSKAFSSKDDKVIQFGNFNTAREQKIEVKDESPVTTKKLHRVVSQDFNHSTKDEVLLITDDKPVMLCGCCTARGQKIQVKDESIVAANKLFQGASEDLNPSVDVKALPPKDDKPLQLGDVSTASGQKFQVKDEFLVTAKKMYQDISENIEFSAENKGLSSRDNKIIQLDGFSTARGQKIEVKDESLVTAKKLLRDVSQDFNQSTKVEILSLRDDPVQLGGFNTARGQKILVKDESFVAAKSLLRDAFNEFNHSNFPPDATSKSVAKANHFDGLSTNRKNRVQINEDSIVTEHKLIEESLAGVMELTISKNSTLISDDLGGFSTSFGKKIQLKDESAAISEMLFPVTKEENYDDSTKNNTFSSQDDKLTRFGGFSTARGQEMQMKDETLAIAEKLLWNITKKKFSKSTKKNAFIPKDDELNRPSGFSAVHGQKIHLKDESFSSAEKMCEGPSEHLNQLTMKTKDKSTPTCKDSFNVCVQSSACTGELSNDLTSEDTSIIWPKLRETDIGLSTAVSEPVRISETGIEEAPRRFLNLPAESTDLDLLAIKLQLPVNEQSYSGFITSLGNRIKISPSALIKANRLLKSSNESSLLLENHLNEDRFTYDIIENASAMLVNVKCDSNITTVPSSVECSRPTSPIFKTRRMSQQKKSKIRRCQNSTVGLNSKPLNVTFSGKSNESMSGDKTNPEGMFRRFKDNFTLKSSKRKEAASNLSLPLPKKTKEIEVEWYTNMVNEQRTYVDNKPTEDCKPREGWYSVLRNRGERVKFTEGVLNTAPKQFNTSTLIELGVRQSVVEVDSTNAVEFVFTSEYLCYGTKPVMLYGDQCPILPNELNEIHLGDIARGFLASPGVDPKLISLAWIRNHYRWIIWKLASTEKSFPLIFARKHLTLDNVLYQLKYRYDREIDKCQRSALKRVLERDDLASKAMVLCVASVKQVSGNINEYKIELTDGWYSVLGQIDNEMSRLISTKKVVVGTKLLLMNAELVGSNEGCDPLQVGDTVRLKIATNSTRRARWSTRLGFFYSLRTPVVRDLKNILPNGGILFPISAVIARIYPTLYMEQKDGGYSELCNEKVELKKAAQFEKERQLCYEIIASQVTREVLQENKLVDNENMDGEPEENVNGAQERFNEQQKLRLAIQKRIEDRLTENFRNSRKVLALIKVRIVNNDGRDPSHFALISIWNPGEDMVSMLKEGRLYTFYNLNANYYRNKELCLTTTRMTKYKLQCILPLQLRCLRYFVSISELKINFTTPFNEIDTVGVVVATNGLQETVQSQQIIYLADLNQNIIAVRFRLNKQNFGFEDVFKHKRILAGANLQWKQGFLYENVPIVFATVYTTFVQKSKFQHLQERLDTFEKFFKSRLLDSFVEECEIKLKSLSTLSSPAATSTPVKVHSKIDLSGRSIDVSLPISNKSENSINSYNGDQKSGSKSILSRMKRLRSYGEPPPLSPITLNARPKCARLSILTRSFKSNSKS